LKGSKGGLVRDIHMVNTPPTNVYEPSSASAAADPKDKSIIQLTFYTPEGWHHFRIPRQMAQVLEGEIGRALGGSFQTEIQRELPRE
jgi:hypothetical protein